MKIARAFAGALRERFGEKSRIHRVILYGSVAWGEDGTGSDIDILIVADNHTLKEATDLATNFLLKHGVVPMVEDWETFNKYGNYTFHRQVLKEGILL